MIIYNGKSITISKDADDIASLVIDVQNERINMFGRSTLAELDEALGALKKEQGIRGMILMSGKDDFITGADVTEFIDWFEYEDDEFQRLMMKVHHSFNIIEDSDYPVVCAINGFALGGGFEFALSADYRVCTSGSTLGLPEVKLGIMPGWGGTIRLPRLIGLDSALEWICTGNHIKVNAALDYGAVDAVVEDNTLLDAARKLLMQAIEGKLDYRARRLRKTSPLPMNKLEQGMVFSASRSFVQARAGPNYPAPLLAVDTIREHATLERNAAEPIEVKNFIELTRTEVARNLVGIFLNDRLLKRIAIGQAGKAEPVKLAAVIGAGIMGGGIAYQSATRSIPVILKDINQEAIDLGLAEVKKQLLKRVERSKMTNDRMADVLNTINPSLSYDDTQNANLIVEAVVEKESVKKSVLKELETMVSEDTILTSNTSTISITELATVLQRPAQFCGMHFFNPVPVMPLVEVIRGEQTSDDTVARTVAYALAIGKKPIVVNDCPGFLINRILFPYLNALMDLLRDGADYQVIDKTMERFGWPMGPAYLLDVVGIDTAVHGTQVMARAYPDRMQAEYKTVLEVLVEQQRLGQKTGFGFYRYEKGKRGKPEKLIDEGFEEVIKDVVAPESDFDNQEIINRMMIPLCHESVRCLQDKIVDTAAEIDMGLVWGLGFPPFRGGALRYIDALGIEKYLKQGEPYRDLGGAYQPPQLLFDMQNEDKRFYDYG